MKRRWHTREEIAGVLDYVWGHKLTDAGYANLQDAGLTGDGFDLFKAHRLLSFYPGKCFQMEPDSAYTHCTWDEDGKRIEVYPDGSYRYL